MSCSAVRPQQRWQTFRARGSHQNFTVDQDEARRRLPRVTNFLSCTLETLWSSRFRGQGAARQSRAAHPRMHAEGGARGQGQECLLLCDAASCSARPGLFRGAWLLSALLIENINNNECFMIDKLGNERDATHLPVNSLSILQEVNTYKVCFKF